MRYLADTNIWLWWLNGSPRLKPAVKRVIENEHDQVWVSVVSGWEVAIKMKRNPLFRLKASIKECFELARMPILDLKLNHVLKAEDLPLHHKDPFDRMLVCQAMAEDLTLITADSKMEKYQVKLLKV